MAFKLNLGTAPNSEEQLLQIIGSVSLAAGRARLCEIFFESIPQFLTQLLMTSAKGTDGVRDLTNLQTLSVVSSAISIAFGISKYAIEKRETFVSRIHSEMASQLTLILYIL